MVGSPSRFFPLVAVAALELGCGPGPFELASGGWADELGEGETADTGEPGEGSSSSSDTSDDTDGSTSTSSTSTTSDSSDDWSDTSDTSDDTGGGLPEGEPCTADSDCASANCYVIPFLGGRCGECNEDADCPSGGCTLPNPFIAPPGGGSWCNLGELGAGCETTEVCQGGLTCATTLDLLGLIQLNSCSECELDNQCGPGALCTPLVELSSFSGVKRCLPPGTLPRDSYCELEGQGDQSCASGLCSMVDVMGLAEIGVCGECKLDGDCPPGQACVPGEMLLDSGELIGSICN